MKAPQRIQLRRTKGWRKPEGAIVVARPSKWGNPFRIVPGMGYDVFEIGREGPCPSLPKEERERMVRQEAVDWYRYWLEGFTTFVYTELRGAIHQRAVSFKADLDPSELAGYDLACWCPLDQPCHADVLLEIANASPPSPDTGETRDG